jgi:hypothetical protein
MKNVIINGRKYEVTDDLADILNGFNKRIDELELKVTELENKKYISIERIKR